MAYDPEALGSNCADFGNPDVVIPRRVVDIVLTALAEELELAVVELLEEVAVPGVVDIIDSGNLNLRILLKGNICIEKTCLRLELCSCYGNMNFSSDSLNLEGNSVESILFYENGRIRDADSARVGEGTNLSLVVLLGSTPDNIGL